MYTFRAVLKDANFGEMFVGSCKPESIDNLFISIQTFNSQSFTEKTPAEFYDYIIVDEFHHAGSSDLSEAVSLLPALHPAGLDGNSGTYGRQKHSSVLQ